MSTATATKRTPEDVKEEDKESQRPNHLNHSSRKVMVQNINMFLKPKDVKKLIDSWLSCLTNPSSVDVHKSTKPPRAAWMCLTLKTDEMVKPFINAVHKSNHNDDAMNGKRFRKDESKGFYAFPSSDDRNNSNKRGRDSKNGDGRDGKKSREKNNSPMIPLDDDAVRDVIVPMWRETYEDQLKKKWRDMNNKCVVKIVKSVRGVFRDREKETCRIDKTAVFPVYDWVQEKNPVAVLPILPSPDTTEYRNKVEFTFGYTYKLSSPPTTAETDSTPTKIPVVGFTPQGWKGPVAHPHCLPNIPSEACGIADIVNKFLERSPIPPYDSLTHRGMWRVLTLRLSRRTGQCMIIISHAPPSGGAGKRDTGEDDYSEHWKSEQKRLIKMLAGQKGAAITTPERNYPDVTHRAITEHEFFLQTSLPEASTLITRKYWNDNKGVQSQSNSQVKVTSIYFQEYDGLSVPSPDHPVQHVYGSTTLTESLGQCEFQISPGAFFQTNTNATEVLYNVGVQRVKEVTGSKAAKTLLLDVCCGTGTIGLTCMKEGAVAKVVGVDISEPAIRDAIANATLNGYDDGNKQEEHVTRFVASKAELVLKDEIHDAENGLSGDGMIVALVDPARQGLHKDVILAIRRCEEIKRLVYVSCNPTGSLVVDATMLCGPPSKKILGTPFRPISGQPVDMFPLTSHCEMVMVFDRMTKDELSGMKKDTAKEVVQVYDEEKAAANVDTVQGEEEVA